MRVKRGRHRLVCPLYPDAVTWTCRCPALSAAIAMLGPFSCEKVRKDWKLERLGFDHHCRLASSKGLQSSLSPPGQNGFQRI